MTGGNAIAARSPLRPKVLAAALALAAAAGARGERPLLADELPPELEGVGIVEHLDERIPLDLEFLDERGERVRLGDFFRPERPVILTLNYYRCPMLCSLTLNGLVEAMNDIDWSAGAEFEIVTLSFNPAEGPELADVKKRTYLLEYDRAGAERGWHFLTGKKREIEALAKAVGFGYRYDPRTQEYAHSSSIMFLTPDGRLSRYMNDVVFRPKDVRLALIESSQGAIGSPMEKFLLFTCYRFDPDAGGYAVSAMKLMRLMGVITVAAIVALVLYLWMRGPRSNPGRLVPRGAAT